MGSEQLNKRLRNQHNILRELHYRGPLRRGELSDRLKIRKSSTTSIISGLLEVGIVVETEPGHMRSALRLDKDVFHVVAADISAGQLAVSRVYLDGRTIPVATGMIEEKAAPEIVLDQCTTFFKEAAAGEENNILGFGISIPGLVDPQAGVCRHAHNLYWENVDLRGYFQSSMNLDVHIDNDTRCQLWSAYWFDRLANEGQNIIYINLDHGVGSSIISGGGQIVGERFAAGEIGNITVGDEGRSWPSGRTDCLEAYCSVPALLSEISKNSEHEPTSAAELASLMKADPQVLELLVPSLKILARTLSGFVAAIDPELVVLGSPDQDLTTLLQPPLQQHLFGEVIGMQQSGTDIRIAGPVRQTSLTGIAARVIDHALHQAYVLRDTRQQAG